jgi:endonuclease/exonuclease/phosphatase family metal-dependent hydrolase
MSPGVPVRSSLPGTIRLLTYNIRKGKGASGRAPQDVAPLGKAVAEQHVDVVLCQEVFHCAKTGSSQSSHLSEVLGFAHYYGANKHRAVGHHGNTTFTRLEVEHFENHDLSTNTVERRGALYARIRLPHTFLHVFNVHLGLNEGQRKTQVQRIADIVHSHCPAGEPVVIAGDFNDWRRALTDTFCRELGFTDMLADRPPQEIWTYHARRPMFALDRIYVRDLRPGHAERLHGEPWATLSDHLPLVAELHLE